MKLETLLETEWSPPLPGLSEECHSMAKPKVEVGDDPGLWIRFSSPQSIHNCLGLASAATVGPAMGLPSLTKGEKSLFIR